jgi:hypothetical protein
MVSTLRGSPWVEKVTNCVTESTTSLTGLVHAFSADMMCVPGSTVNSSVTTEEDFWHVLIDVTDERCATGLITLAMVQRDSQKYTQAFTIGKTILQECSDVAQPSLFMVFAQVETTADAIPQDSNIKTPLDRPLTQVSINTTVVVCTPEYKVQKALVTTDAYGALQKVEEQPGSVNLTVSNWDLWSAVNRSVIAAESVFLEGPAAHDSRVGGSSYDSFFGVIMSTWTRQPLEYLDPGTLTHDIQRLFSSVANQIASSHLATDSDATTAGAYKATRNRVLLLNESLRAVEAGIAITIVCACLMIVYSPWTLYSAAGDSTSMLAVILARSGRLKASLVGNGSKSYEVSKQGLSTSTFSCMHCHNSTEDDILQAYNTDNSSAIDASEDDPEYWRPLALTKLIKAIIIVMPLALIASLEVTYRFSHKNDDYGLADIPSDHRWHYAWTWPPALVMTVTKLLYQSVTSSISLLDPYDRLRRQRLRSDRILVRNNLSKTSLQLCFEALRSRRWALLATALSALLGPFLTIVVSGLFFSTQPETLDLDATFHLADHIASPSGRYCSSQSWTQGSLCAAGLVDTAYAFWPRGTVEHYVYPLQPSNQSYTTMRGARLFNASRIQRNVLVVLSNVTCQAMDPTGFRHTLDTGGSLNQTAWSIDGEDQDHMSEPYLNLTHADLAGYRCEDSWFSCGDHACADNGTHCTNTMLSLGFDLDPKKSDPFVKLLYASELSTIPSIQWTSPTSWPDSQALTQAVAIRNSSPDTQNPDLVVIYGSWIPGHLNLSGIQCYFDIRSGRVDITHQINNDQVVDVLSHDETFSTLPDTGNCTPWNGPNGDQLESFLPNNGSLWKTALNGTNATTFRGWFNSDLYSLDGAGFMASQIEDIYNSYYTQFYNVALRDHNMTSSTRQATGYMFDDNWQRLVQSKVSTRILQVLLGAMWFFTTIALFLFDVKNLMPKNPCSIAAQASLLADSKFLDMIPAGAENATAEELMKMTPFVDHEFSMGWWDDEDGGRRFGIDVGKADFNKDKDDVGLEEEETGVEMVDITPKDGYSAVGEVDDRASVDIAWSGR